MAKTTLKDGLWAATELLRRIHVPSPYDGHPRVSDWAALTIVLYVLQTCIACEHLTKEMGGGFGMSCSRRLHD